MAVLIILNIILIILLIFLIIYIFRNKKYEDKGVSENNHVSNINVDKDDNKIKEHKHHKHNKKIEESERVFVGRFITDEEYKSMTVDRKGSISSLMKELNNEYEYLKELSK
jgi:cell division protein YceG involved in septum cleavage